MLLQAHLAEVVPLAQVAHPAQALVEAALPEQLVVAERAVHVVAGLPELLAHQALLVQVAQL